MLGPQIGTSIGVALHICSYSAHQAQVMASKFVLLSFLLFHWIQKE